MLTTCYMECCLMNDYYLIPWKWIDHSEAYTRETDVWLRYGTFVWIPVSWICNVIKYTSHIINGIRGTAVHRSPDCLVWLTHKNRTGLSFLGFAYNS
jgi:hypothetical protein